jgi:hypothetical protein
MATPIFYLHIVAEGCTAEIRLNDAPIYTLVREEPARARPTISEWVIDSEQSGENWLSVQIVELDPDARLRVAFCQAKLGDVPVPGSELELAVIEWPPPLVAGAELPAAPELPLPLNLPAIPVMAKHPWGRWSWQDAPPFAVDARSTGAVIDYVRDLHATLAAGSVDALIAHSQVKFKEVAPAYELTPADAELRIRQAWEGLTSHGEWAFAEWNVEDLDLRLHCGGRLVEPTTLAGEPILRQARPIDGESWSLPIFIARTHWDITTGHLTIVR